MKGYNFKTSFINNDQLNEVVECHMATFPSSLTTKLGNSYVKKMFEWYIVSDDRFLVGISVENKIVGYLGAAKGTGSTSAILQYAFWQGISSIILRPYLVFNVNFLSNLKLLFKNIYRRLFYRRKDSKIFETKIDNNSNIDLSMGLVVVGVHPKYTRIGIATILLKVFSTKSKELAAKYGHLSVKTSNENAICLYKKNNWEIVRSNVKSTFMELRIK